MVLIFDDPFGDGEGLIGDGGGGGGSGVGGEEPIDDIRPPEGGDEDPRVTLLPVPTGRYRKTRHSPALRNVTPLAGTGTNTEAQEIIPGPTVDIVIRDRNAQYRIVGFFPFDNSDYDFTIVAPELIRVLFDGVAIIDDFVPAATRTKVTRIPVAAGSHQVEIQFGFEATLANFPQRLQFSFTKVPTKTWVSCEDGLERPGDPPIGFIQTADGCFKPPLGDQPSNIDLLEVVQVDTTSKVERAYILESGAGLTPHRMKFFNRAENMSVKVQLLGPKPVLFVTAFVFAGDLGVGGTPSDSFELQPKQERLVDMLFNTAELDVLPEGLITSEILIGLDAGTITLAKDGDDDIDIGRPIDEEEFVLPVEEEEEEEILPPSPTWRDCSGTSEVLRSGFPPEDFVLRADGCYVAPAPPEPTPTLSIGFTELTPRFEGTRGIARARLTANLGDLGSTPLSAFTFRWNFDKAGQGAGSGDTTTQITTAEWRMTESDLRRLEDTAGRQTTRSVEVIVSSGTKIVRTTLQVVLDNTGLIFIFPPVDDPVILPPIDSGGGGGGGGGGGDEGDAVFLF